MATGENPTQASSPQPTGSRQCREVRHINDSQEAQQYSDQLWQSKQQGSPSLLLYRKLSCDSWRILDEENGCFNYSSKLLSTEDELYPELSAGKRVDRITNAVTPKPGKSSEGSPCQLDTPGEGVVAGRNRTGSTHCSCTLSSLYMSQNTYCCSSPSPRSSPSPNSSPSQPNQQHIRRSSLPVSVLAFQKVIMEGSADYLVCTALNE